MNPHSCQTCRYWGRVPFPPNTNRDEDVDRCQRFPEAVWTRKDYWCGEFAIASRRSA